MALVFNELCAADVKFKAPHSMKDEIAKAAYRESTTSSEWLRTVVSAALARKEFTDHSVTSSYPVGMAQNVAQVGAQDLSDIKNWPTIIWLEGQ